MELTPLLAVVGPTASGKTALGIELANCFHGEIISADSMQIYRGLRIGTAQPTPAEQEMAPHHLIDFVPLEQAFSAADYVSAAHKVIADVTGRGKLPVLVGGTGFYVDSVVRDIRYTETKREDSVRQELEQMSNEALLSELILKDPVEAARIDRYNRVRLLRAVEICRVTNGTVTAYKEKNLAHPSRYRTFKVGISFRDRSLLYERIDRRVTRMLEEGLVEEAKEVLSKDKLQTAMQAIGYKELIEYFNGKVTLQEAADQIRLASRRYAKRQLSWFRRDPQTNWFYWDDDNDPSVTIAKIKEAVSGFLH